MATLPIIQNKSDFENARRLVDLGYPTVSDALPAMLTWLQDMNWPVAKVVAPFLATIGTPLLPEIQRVMKSEDHIWKYWCISELIAEMPLSTAREFVPELLRLSEIPTAEERHEELHEVATAALQRLGERGGV